MSGATKLMTAGGGGVSLTPASSIASDVTVNVPSVNGTLVSTGSTAQVSQAMLAAGVAGTGPAFSALLSSNQSVTTSTATKLQFATEEYDTNNCFDTSNYRFTPNVAGYYQINLSVYPNTATTATQAYIYKNGAMAKRNFINATNNVSLVTAAVYCNGSSDYIEAYGYLIGTTPIVDSNSSLTYFQASLVRAA